MVAVDSDRVGAVRNRARPGGNRPLVIGTEDAAAGVRPLASDGRRHQRYSLALRDVEQPRLFENRLAWHLAGVDWSQPDYALTFTTGTYFGGVDVSEALAHEMAMYHVAGDGSGILPASWRNLGFRRLVGDPFTPSRRPTAPSTDTLTLRVDDDGASFVLHNRAAGNVAVAGECCTSCRRECSSHRASCLPLRWPTSTCGAT